MSAPQSTDKPGGPSRPIPHRTLAQPARLSVVHRSSGQLDRLVGNGRSDVHTLQNDLIRRKEASQRAEKWMDRLMEETPTSTVFKKALSYLNARQYRDVLHERHLNSHCSYPGCSNPPSAPYTSARRFKISTTHRTIKEKEGNEEEGFCSRKCMVRSRWVEDQLDHSPVWARGGKGEGGMGVALLEELQERELEERGLGQVVEVSEDAALTKTGPSRTREAPVKTRASRREPPRMRGSTQTADTATATEVNDSAKSNQVGTPPGKPSGVSELLSSLTIHERPTPPSIPTAPSLVPVPSLPDKSIPKSISTSTTSTPTTLVPNPTSSRRPLSSLVPTPAKLTSTVLSASRKMGPIPQLAPDSEDEEDVRDWGEEGMGLGWGVEDEEMKRLFEQAHRAREFIAE